MPSTLVPAELVARPLLQQPGIRRPRFTQSRRGWANCSAHPISFFHSPSHQLQAISMSPLSPGTSHSHSEGSARPLPAHTESLASDSLTPGGCCNSFPVYTPALYQRSHSCTHTPRQCGYLLTLLSDSLTDSGTHVLDALRLDIPRYLLSVPTYDLHSRPLRIKILLVCPKSRAISLLWKGNCPAGQWRVQ